MEKLWYRYLEKKAIKERERLIVTTFTGIITLRSDYRAVYCNRSCLWVGGFVCLCVGGWVCCHNSSKLRESILTKLGLWVKVVTVSS